MRYVRRAAAILIFILPLAAAVDAATVARKDNAVVERRGDAILFMGRIDALSAQRFIQLSAATGVRRVIITSRGGLVEPALDMAEAIHQRHLDVEVPAACLSSCANYIFLAAARKTLGHAAAVGWHGNMTHVVHLERLGQGGPWTPHEMDQARELARRERAFYQQIGVDGFICWFAKLPPYNVDDFYYLSAHDMQRFGAADVVVRDPAARAAPGENMVKVVVDWARLESIRP